MGEQRDLGCERIDRVRRREGLWVRRDRGEASTLLVRLEVDTSEQAVVEQEGQT